MNKEANKCLLCRNPFCAKGCPAHTPIPQVIQLYREGKLDEAGAILFENNPLSAVCSIVCNWEGQCTGSCVLNRKGSPVHFYEIEQEISTAYLKNLHLNKPESNGIRAAVIGTGPAGITCALKLAMKGYDSTMFEQNDVFGGVMTTGIPAFRLDKSIVMEYERLLKELGVHFRYATRIGEVITLNKLFEDGYASVFAGIGFSLSKSMDVKGESYPHVHYAIDYLKNPEAFELGKKVIVIGGGNVAMDTARTAKRQGYDTWIYYRKDFDNMPATRLEIEETKADGVQFAIFEAPVEFVPGGAVFCKCENVDVGKERPVTKIIEGTEHEVQADAIICAVSQTSSPILLNGTTLTYNRYGCLEVDENYMTALDGLFATGDIVTGARTVVEAMDHAKDAAAAMDAYMQEKCHE